MQRTSGEAVRNRVMGRSHSVLVVDDEVNVRDLYVDALEAAGHQVTVARDGVDALARLRGGSVPCVVLADVNMPRMDGWELSREAARDPQLSSVPIVMVTGNRMLSFTSPARDKPYSINELDALVQRSCRLHREEPDSAAG
jgi:CheY-like chemotaxis protein